MPERKPVPRDRDDDYTREAPTRAGSFAEEQTGASLEHVGGYSFDPAETSGNIEQFTGVAQVPIGLAGPVKVDGEHAQGDFYVPMATAEGTLVASYNRGMRLLYETGGIKTTILDDRMQRAPAFLFAERARDARLPQLDQRELRGHQGGGGGTTKSTGKLLDIELYPASRILYTRFNYTTGDAAGQNLTGKATQAACHWIVENNPTIEHFFLESNFATDKKSSQVNMLRTRGKRVVAEAVIPNELIEGVMRTSTEMMFRARQVSQLGGFMSGVTNNGSHSANGVTAIFIATGQDAANVAESSAALRLRRAARERRLLLLDHHPVADRRHLRRRHRPAHPARVPGAAGVLRHGQGAASSPRSWPPPCCAARSRWAPPSWPRSGSTPTTCSGATGPRENTQLRSATKRVTVAAGAGGHEHGQLERPGRVRRQGVQHAERAAGQPERDREHHQRPARDGAAGRSRPRTRKLNRRLAAVLATAVTASASALAHAGADGPRSARNSRA